VYRAVGYLSSHLPEIPFDHQAGVITNDRGRVLDLDGVPLPGLYVTGWIKRGPVGLIGHTKSDAAETIASLLADLDQLPRPEIDDPQAILDHLAGRGATVIDADGWSRLDAHEIALGAAAGRERIKVVPREAMIEAANG
jgi:ferredoxin--NADP+ reductase